MIEKTVSTICREQWSVSESEKCGNVIEALRKDSNVLVVPVTDESGDPVGLIDKNAALMLASNPLHYAVMQNKTVRALMQDRYMRFEETVPIDLVANQLLNEGYSLSKGGFIVTRDGHYAGVGVNTDTLNYLVEINNLRARELAKLNEEMTDSVKYASRIQGGLLPHMKLLHDKLSTIDVIWEPRDIVGGDIYWRSEENNKDFFTLGLIDCTGHGVPGALMSMLVISNLNRIYSENENINPGAALAKLGNIIRAALNQDKENAESNDGFDAGLCKVDLANNKVIFSGARTNCFATPKSSTTGVLRVPGERQALGYPGSQPYEPLEEYEISLDDYKLFTMVSDGILDQPGGPNCIAFGPKRLMQVIENNRDFNALVLIHDLHKLATEWRKDEVRRDDLSAMAFGV
jgi:predicted transcriptional regulator